MDCKMSEQSAIVLAAGTAITMACIKRIMVMFFAEEWRTKVFLVLNLVLLAIFFTSVRSSNNSYSNGLDQESSKNGEVKVGKMKRRKLQCRSTNNGLSESRSSCKVCDSKMENSIGVEMVSNSTKESRVQFSSGLNKMTRQKSDENVVDVHEVEDQKQFEVDESDQCSNKLSKEELNERAEAFIAMFRQHLALDGREGR